MRQRMIAPERILESSRYARCIESSKRVRWDIDEDVIRGRRPHIQYGIVGF
jgi:hypothetical protein